MGKRLRPNAVVVVVVAAAVVVVVVVLPAVVGLGLGVSGSILYGTVEGEARLGNRHPTFY